MHQEYKYTLKEALGSHKRGSIFQWTQDYLRNEGNNDKLANYLVEKKPTIIELIDFPLSKLVRITGPENGMRFAEPKDVWDIRVNDLIQKIREGIELPPLIVTDFWSNSHLQLSDGTHRHEALIRSGYEKYWTIFLFCKPETKKLILEV